MSRMSIAEKLTRIAANEQEVYNAGYAAGQAAGGGGYDEGFEAGKKAEYDAFWDAAQENGNRTDYAFAFSGNMWSQETFKPKYPIKPTKCTNMLAYWGYGNAILNNELIDLRFLSVDLSDCTDCSGIFYANRMIRRVGEIDGGSLALANLFSACFNLESVDLLAVTEETTFSSAFVSCINLEDITFSGSIAKDIDLHWSTKLSLNSIESLLMAVYDRSNPDEGSRPTVTLSREAINRAYETSDGANDGEMSLQWTTGWAANANFNIALS